MWSEGSQNGQFRADWNSLSQYQVPDWYRDAKFGIFIHWGVYSVPAFGSEWYPRQMYTAGSKENEHQVSLYGPLTKFGYKDFIPMFKAQHYDPRPGRISSKNPARVMSSPSLSTMTVFKCTTAISPTGQRSRWVRTAT